MTTTLDALLAAVLHDPDADAPRLVYADALEETGRECDVARAELIRLQVAGEGAGRQMELLRAGVVGWLPAGVGWGAELTQAGWWRVNRGLDIGFTRGFASAVRLTDPTVRPWTESTPPAVAAAHSQTVAALFAENPLARVVIDFREAETLTVERAAGGPWTAGVTFAAAPPRSPGVAVTAADRAAFADQLARHVRGRLFALGQWVIAGQDGPF